MTVSPVKSALLAGCLALAAATGAGAANPLPIAPEQADGLGVAILPDDPLGPDTWAGVSRDTVFQLVSRLPEAYDSPTLRILARRLLTAPSAPPVPPPPAPSLLALRLTKLTALGESDVVDLLIRQTPPRHAPEEMARVRAEHYFLTGRDTEACAVVEPFRSTGDPYWANSRAACLALGDKARDALNILTPLTRDGLEDEAVLALVERQAGRRVDLPIDLDLTPPAVALYRKAGQLPPIPELDRAPGAEALAFSSLKLPGRLAAAETAARTGAMPPERLRALYAERAAVTDPKDAAEAPLARARAIQLATSTSDPVKRADALATAFDLAEGAGLLPVMARVALPTLQALNPAPALVQHSPRFARMALLAGDPVTAVAWAKTLHGAAASDANLADQALRLSILMGLATPELAGAPDPAQIADWALLTGDGGQSAALLLAVMQGLGENIPGPLWDVLPPQLPIAPQPVEDAAIWLRLPSAAEAGRTGEALALGLILSQGMAIPSSEPLRLSLLLATLRQLGLERDARQVALESAILSGL
jgi:hypothetical protein